MSIADIKSFNFLVHYGFRLSNNLTELLEEALVHVLKRPPKIYFGGTQYIKELQVLPIHDGYAFTGLFYKKGTLKWTSVPDEDDEPKEDPGTKHVLPYARFVLFYPSHQLLWITQRGLSKSPSAIDFCRYIRRTTHPILKERYKLIAESLWEVAEDDLREDGYAQRRYFVNEFLTQHNLTGKHFQVRVVPEISLENVLSILQRDELKLVNVKLYPYMNNVTDEDCEELFTKADKFANEAQSQGIFELKPKDSKIGVDKKPIVELLKVNDSKSLVRVDFTLKDKTDEQKRPVRLSTADGENTVLVRTEKTEGDIRSQETIIPAISRFPDIVQNVGEAPEHIQSLIDEELRDE